MTSFATTAPPFTNDNATALAALDTRGVPDDLPRLPYAARGDPHRGGNARWTLSALQRRCRWGGIDGVYPIPQHRASACASW